MLRHILAGALVLAAAGGVMAAGSTAHAEIYAPYARAGAIVDSDGRLNLFKNVISSRRVSTGRYCVRVADFVDVSKALIQITPRRELRLPYIAFRNPSSTCHERNTLAVHVTNPHTGELADGGFDLTIA
ncbi:hypothetical protein GCM10022224_064550 [Nonomuraea antimicrobica]|uniref:Uncharacterized protein n=1 Tax=Nonomuraea antimicrobica TaxID=561173 RepID=A0ABP7CJS8_9ACTN